MLLLRRTLLLLASSSYTSIAMSSPPTTYSVVGVGVLGTHLCRLILDNDPDARVVGVTQTDRRHQELRDTLGERFSPTTQLTEKSDHLVFCAPPSGFEDYGDAVADAATFWNGQGSFVLTSSGAVYGETTDTVNESTPLSATSTPRIDRLRKAEAACTRAGGVCLRLAGLYDLERGAHNYWLKSPKPIAADPNGIVNQVHYHDAAVACYQCLNKLPSLRSSILLLSDGNPLSRREICQAALQSSRYQSFAMPEFAASGTPAGVTALGKIYDGTETNRILDWKPEHESFAAFMKTH